MLQQMKTISSTRWSALSNNSTNGVPGMIDNDGDVAFNLQPDWKSDLKIIAQVKKRATTL
jgi:hypothetical protein